MFELLYDQYHLYSEKRIRQRRISQELWDTLIQEWSGNPFLEVTEIGKTYLQKPIHQIKYGQGPIRICAWSQMHGDEATATIAIVDLLIFLTHYSRTIGLGWEKLHQKISLYIIPRLNHDGANLWTRETALGIDMNRDAQTLFSPEAQILYHWAEKIQPTFAFNLHDQNRLYSVGNTEHQTHIAFLATAGDELGTWSESRIRAAKLANRLTRQLMAYIPHKIAKWTDEYNPRAFGDTFQSLNYGLILLESGGAGWDLEKQSLRKLNTCLLLDSLYAISEGLWQEESTDSYESLLTNERNLADLKLRQAPLDPKGNHRADIILNIHEQVNEQGEIEYSWIIEEIGDMSVYFALTDIDASSFQQAKPQILKKEAIFTDLVFLENDSICFNLTDYTHKINKVS